MNCIYKCLHLIFLIHSSCPSFALSPSLSLSQWHTKWGHVFVRPHLDLAFHYTRGHTLEFDLAVWIFKLQVHINLIETCKVSVIVLVLINIKYDLGINGTRVTFVSFARIRLLSLLKKNQQVFATVYFMIMVLRSPHHIVYNNRKQQVS